MLLEEFNLNYINNRNKANGILVQSTDSPLNKKNVDDSKREFETCYKRSFKSPDGKISNINTNIIVYPLKIKLSDFITHLGLDKPVSPGEGAAFYYILKQDIDGRFYFTYGITQAIYNNNQVTPQHGIKATYLIPLNTGGMEKVSSQEIQNHLASYQNNISIRELSNNTTTLVSQFTNQFGRLHPTNTFQNKEFLTQFITDNNFDITNPPQNVHVRIYHGGIYLSQYEDNDIRVQTSILVLEDENQILLLNNNGFSNPHIYFNKGLNVGRLCPPDC